MKKLIVVVIALILMFGVFAVSGYADYRERYERCSRDLKQSQSELEDSEADLAKALIENNILTKQVDVLTEQTNELYAQLAVKDKMIKDLQIQYEDALASYYDCETDLKNYQKNWFFGGAFSVPIGGSAFAGYMFDEKPYGLFGQLGYMKNHGYINIGFLLRH